MSDDPHTQRAHAGARQALLEAAEEEFTARGLHGARVDEIARGARVNKRMLYYYFSSKDELYGHVLERAYLAYMKYEAALPLEALDPVGALTTLIGAKFDYLDAHPRLARRLSDENLHGGAHLRRATSTLAAFGKNLERLTALLSEGHRQGLFRIQADPMLVSLSIAAVVYFYHASLANISAMFGHDPGLQEKRAHYRRYAVELILPSSAVHGVSH